MKKLLVLLWLFIIFFTYNTSSQALVKYKILDNNSFRAELANYGNWVKIKGGINVWKPYKVSSYWQPYRLGRWVWSDYGWYWESNEAFGKITYHYGRWYYDDYYGWVWIKGNTWAPAWVDWRYNDNYIGWAPLPPYAEFSINIGIHFTKNFHYGYNYWSFVKYRNFSSRNIYNYFVAKRYKYRIYSRTKYRNNYYYKRGRVYNNGVDFAYVNKRSRGRIVKRNINRFENRKFRKLRSLKFKKKYNKIRELRRREINRNTRKYIRKNIKRKKRNFINKRNDIKRYFKNDRKRKSFNKSFKNRVRKNRTFNRKQRTKRRR